MPIDLTVADDYEEMSKKAATIVGDKVKENPGVTLGLATGGTPVGCYENLVDMYKKGELDFSDVTTFNLDEYIGLEPDHPQSYHYYMDENLFDHINLKEENIHIPNGLAKNPEEECKDYEKAIERAGGIDLQLLGIGENGHVAFNEPGSSFDSKTRIVELSEKTRGDNARFFESKSDVPKGAISMGIETIRKADQILLMQVVKERQKLLQRRLKGL